MLLILILFWEVFDVYANWFFSQNITVDENLMNKEYLIGDFSAADIMLGHACFMANRLGCMSDELKELKDYVKRISDRPAFKVAMEMK